MKRSAVWKTISRRGKVLACALCALALVLLPAGQGARQAQAAYMDPYIEQAVQLGLMRGDIEGNLMPENDISRAEFVTIINRAFGYDAMGGIPFEDVPADAWYAEDVDIAYTAGYITGTSESTFSPLASLTREEAVVILARNLMMQPSVGENISFSDSRDLSAWSRGLVATAAGYGIIEGYPDGSFHPQEAITRGDVAVMLLKAVGTPIQEPGEESLGEVWGNVTITTSGVTLRDTVVGGNLYITAGVGLGGVILENVTVLGEIVVSGGGVSERGDDSVVLRNVDAPSLIVDNLKNQLVSLRVEGNSVLDDASVRTDTYLVDNTPSGAGVLQTELNGEEGLSLTLSGNIEEVVNRTPGSTLMLSSGQASVITVDEAATESLLEIVSGAKADTVNLDTATELTGDGDIGHLVVNAPGSTVAMLPDQITIRPGITATIDGEVMDSEAAAEASADPRLLAGYPQVTDLAPTTASVQFSGNKRGTVYWAVTSVTDGSVETGDLLSPPSYTTTIVANGAVELTGANQPATVQITRLTSDGSYYLSAVMQDVRGDQSPLKVISFTTPDDSVPGFADGYPYLSRITNVSAQATVMTTKTCRLYWAVLPAGAAAPTAQDFRANAVTGNLGFGTLDVTKNTPYSFDVNNVALEELEDYTLYLWLTDIGGGQSSRVESLDFTTVDRTPPIFNTNATVNRVERTSVGLYANLNEDGILYWVVVPQGEEYPKPLAGQTGAVDLASDTAKLQVSSGMNALDSGSVRMRAGEDIDFTVSGLEPETAYDLYYVAQDEAGNYSARVQMITIHTLDSNAPTVTQEFTEYNGTEVDRPLPSTDIRLVFSETVQSVSENRALTDYYQAVVSAATDEERASARETMANFLRSSIQLYVNTGNGRPDLVPEATGTMDKTTEDWVIDYRYAEITMEDGKTVVTFPTSTVTRESALNLASGGTYYFQIVANTICDTSDARNNMGTTTLDEFTTVFAIVNLSNPNITSLELYTLTPGDPALDDEAEVNERNRVDVSWTLDPMSTESTSPNIDWDMIIWSDTSVVFELYARNTEGGTQSAWEYLGTQTITVPDGTERIGVSLTRHFLDPSNAPNFHPLNTLREAANYEYAIHFTQIGSLVDPDTWSQRVNITINILAGTTNDLQTLANNLTVEHYAEMVPASITDIGLPEDFNLTKQFSDQQAPQFSSNHPTFATGSSAVNMYLMLDRPGTIYYVVAPKGTIPTRGTDANGEIRNFSSTAQDNDDYLYLDEAGYYEGNGTVFVYRQSISTPARLDIVNASNSYGANNRIKYGATSAGPSEIEVLVEGLEPEQDYIAYFVIQGTSNQAYSAVYAYRFTTREVDIPYITMEAVNPEVSFTTTEDADLDYALFAYNQLPQAFLWEMSGSNVVEGADQNPVGSVTDPGEIMTVLEAMLQTKDRSTGESYFDRYASQTLKDTVQEIIQRRQTGGGGSPVTTGSLETEMAQIEFVDFTNAMQSGEAANATYFYCLATAQNALGSGYSFKAVENVHIPDTEPPYLITVGGSATEMASQPGYYQGTLTLIFNEPIYYMDRRGNSSAGDPATLRPIVSVPSGQAGSDNDYISILDAALTSDGNFSVNRTSTSATTTFNISYAYVPLDATFNLSGYGVVSDASENSTLSPFTLTLQQTTSGVNDMLTVVRWTVIAGDYRPANGQG